MLLEGSRHFRSHFLRPQAISLLRRARTIEAWHFEAVFELARHLTRSDQAYEARILLENLAGRTTEDGLRRVRAAQLRIDPGPTALWRWLLCVLGRAQAQEAPRPTPEGVVPLRRAQRRKESAQ